MMERRTYLSALVLGGLLSLVFLALMISPAAESGREYSSTSAGPNGLRIVHDVASRLGWIAERREVEFSDTLTSPAMIQALVKAPVSAIEAHALLEHVRRGGGLLVAGDAGALDDSLPTVPNNVGIPVEKLSSESCRPGGSLASQMTQYSRGTVLAWRRPAPPDTVGFGMVEVREDHGTRAVNRRPAYGYPLGAGRMVIVSDANFLVNDMVRRCEVEADVMFVRMIEYLSRGERGRRIAFDEYHHGYGVRGGSLTAIRMYLGGTHSGRMLAQMGIAGLLLLFAAAPRPLAPRDPARVARRSPLEHADALAHAYASVNATRTATVRLLAGVRRRVRRERSRVRESDEQLLATASAVSPEASAAAASIASALVTPISDRELPAIATALNTVEAALSARPTSPNR